MSRLKLILGAAMVAVLAACGTQNVQPAASGNDVVALHGTGGCTYTQGYWKNHTSHPAWTNEHMWHIDGTYGVNTTFFHSKISWINLFNTPPRGNAYIILAHQFMAAKLNKYNGAGMSPEVAMVFQYAVDFFNNPANSMTSWNTSMRAKLLEWAGILDQWNNGYLGTPHCG